MAGKSRTSEYLTCRYSKCSYLHETNLVPRSEAVKDGKCYYHSDCYHIKSKVDKIRDLFIREIDPLLTKKEIGGLVSVINRIIYDNNVEIDLLEFALEYYIKYKPGSLKHPPGLFYIVRNENVLNAWEKEKQRKLRMEVQAEIEKNAQEEVAVPFELPDPVVNQNVQKNSARSRFSSVIGG